MRSHDSLIGKIFVPPPNRNWVVFKHGIECELPPGQYMIVDYHHSLFELDCNGERFTMPARSLLYYGDYFGCIRESDSGVIGYQADRVSGASSTEKQLSPFD